MAKHVRDDEVVTLWTIQTEEAYQKLLDNGVLEVPDDKYIDPFFIPSFEWLKEKMVERGVAPSRETQVYPVWAWYLYEGKRGADLRTTGYVKKGTRAVRIQFDIPRSEIVLSDFDLWHHVLNDIYLSLDADEEERYWDDPDSFSEEDVRNSWDAVFDIEGIRNHPERFDLSCQSIQATFWCLKSKYVTGVTHFVGR